MKEGDRVMTPDGAGTVIDYRADQDRWVVDLDEPSLAGWGYRRYVSAEISVIDKEASDEGR